MVVTLCNPPPDSFDNATDTALRVQRPLGSFFGNRGHSERILSGPSFRSGKSGGSTRSSYTPGPLSDNRKRHRRRRRNCRRGFCSAGRSVHGRRWTAVSGSVGRTQDRRLHAGRVRAVSDRYGDSEDAVSARLIDSTACQRFRRDLWRSGVRGIRCVYRRAFPIRRVCGGCGIF